MGEKIGAAPRKCRAECKRLPGTLFVHGSEERAAVRNRKEKEKRAPNAGAFLCAVRVFGAASCGRRGEKALSANSSFFR